MSPASIIPSTSRATSCPIRLYTVRETAPAAGIENEIVVAGLKGFGSSSLPPVTTCKRLTLLSATRCFKPDVEGPGGL